MSDECWSRNIWPAHSALPADFSAQSGCKKCCSLLDVMLITRLSQLSASSEWTINTKNKSTPKNRKYLHVNLHIYLTRSQVNGLGAEDLGANCMFAVCCVVACGSQEPQWWMKRGFCLIIGIISLTVARIPRPARPAQITGWRSAGQPREQAGKWYLESKQHLASAGPGSRDNHWSVVTAVLSNLKSKLIF